MGSQRRYGEDEVREIFADAAREGPASLPASVAPIDGGLTLGELQAVGLEVGLSAERVARAAATLDARAAALPRRKLLGFPISAGRVTDLPREATEREWQFLVAELRATFDAKGEVSAEGGVREWSNGNLHAVLEQTAAGHRLRLGTLKGDARETTALGVVGLVMALILAVIMTAAGREGAALIMPVVIGLAGAGALAANALRLPRWAGERERQMEHVAAWTRDLLSAPPKE
ncbi:hypothetical protein [Candidatus Palauibacter sp.]|uniref:hypothetical protein n=1 Tax=Candidatus Palauibacter sp. TaxID=3101350 RepID=UPI003AF21ADE